MKNMDEKPLIFISYGSKDEELARAFEKAIRFDFLDFPRVFCSAALEPGTRWQRKIRDALRSAALVCVLCSERLETRWVSIEIGAAWISDVEIIPICYGNRQKTDLPEVLSKRQAIKAESDGELEKLYAKLAKILGCRQPAVSIELKRKIASFQSNYRALSVKEVYERQRDVQRAEAYRQMKDGTIKAINPMTGTLVWTVRGRQQRPVANTPDRRRVKLGQVKTAEDTCPFCEENYYETTPERSRIEKEDDVYVVKRGLSARDVFAGNKAEFRRIPNLFAILSYSYWKDNYGYKPSLGNASRRRSYMGTDEGRAHVQYIIKRKRELTEGEGPKDEVMEEALFSESHDLIIARRHFKEGARFDDEHAGTGDLTPAEHMQYFRLTIDAVGDLFKQNRYIKYVAVFQNWLRPSGATVDHLHKQLVGIDEFGLPIDRALRKKEKNPEFFSDRVAFASKEKLVLAENQHAVAYIDPGRRYPTVAVCAKRLHSFLGQPDQEGIRGMSDLVLACHAAVGSGKATNEEWYYTPPRAGQKIPWHILILQRINVQAGFEHATRIHLNPYRPEDLRFDLALEIERLQSAGLFSDVSVVQQASGLKLEY